MKTVNSISGGKTSAYIAAHYPADYNLFCLVTTSDKNCLYPDKKLRQIVSDKIGREFIGTLEEDAIIHTMLDLEQYIGKEITWLNEFDFDDLTIPPVNTYPAQVRSDVKDYLRNFNEGIFIGRAQFDYHLSTSCICDAAQRGPDRP